MDTKSSIGDQCSPVAAVLKPESVGVTDPGKLVPDDGVEELARSVGGLQKAAGPDIHVIH